MPGQWANMPSVSNNITITKFVNPGLWVIQRLCAALDAKAEDIVETRYTADDVASASASERLRSRVFRLLVRKGQADLTEAVVSELGFGTRAAEFDRDESSGTLAAAANAILESRGKQT